MATLNFAIQYDYSAMANQGIIVPVVLEAGGESVRLQAKIDTGAEFCLFERDYGELLGLDIEAGERKVFNTLTGNIEGFGHEVTIDVLDIRFSSQVYFSTARRNLLGRVGWIRNMRLAVIDYSSLLHISHFDEA